MSIIRTPQSFDVIVVGARCAGAATAMLLARRGARVLMVDRAAEGSDTLSTHALMRGAVMQLHNWGVLPAVIAQGTPPVRRTSFVYGDAPGIDIDLGEAHGTHALYAPRRTVLDKQLVLAAREAGVVTRFGVSVARLLKSANGVVNGVVLRDRKGEHEVSCDLVIGADGRDSIVARQVGAATTKLGRNCTRTAYAYFTGLPDRGYRWHWGNGCGGGITPTNNGQSGVFLSVGRDGPHDIRKAIRPEGFRAAMRALMPQLADELAGAEFATRIVGFPGQPGYLRQSCGHGWALVGDAGYFKDPITAHGITDALRDAQILADAWAAERLDDYVATRDMLSRDIFRLSDAIAGCDQPLSRVAELHRSLNIAMKANQAWIADNLYVTRARRESRPAA